MSSEFIDRIRKIGSLDKAIISSVILYKGRNEVEVKLVTDKAFSDEDEREAKKIVREFVPDYFACSLIISKLTPDEGMIKKKIYSVINENNRQLAALLSPEDISVQRTERGFYFEIEVISESVYGEELCKGLCAQLSRSFCGEFTGRCVRSDRSIEDVEVEEEHENIEYEVPIRTFDICGFEFIEGETVQKTAVYLADLNFVAESVAVCGRIVDIRERTINSRGRERTMFSFTLSDGTATTRIAYFARQKSIDKIKALKVGESVVLTCRTEIFNGDVRPTAVYVDYGRAPEGFVPKKRASKPVPEYYKTVFPEAFSDYTQDNLFADNYLPACLTENEFVVFDLETTGLNSSPSSGMMDRIIEIGAYKIAGGEIRECFNTFVNPKRRLSEEIVKLTGIDQQTVDGAPTYEEVMPDFFKFINGCYLVGHNAANFDYKFIEYYCSACGYEPERRIFDTLPFAQQLLRLSNYKLNTVADYFGITFNHHRAADDALVTAKIFIELVKLKKSLPTLC